MKRQKTGSGDDEEHQVPVSSSSSTTPETSIETRIMSILTKIIDIKIAINKTQPTASITGKKEVEENNSQI